MARRLQKQNTTDFCAICEIFLGFQKGMINSSIMKPMARLKYYFEMLRPLTLLPPALGMITAGICAMGARPWLRLAESSRPLSETGLNILLGAIMAACLNAASNTINQIADLENDRINKPHRVIPSERVSVPEAWIVGILFWALALGLAWMVTIQCFVIVCIASIIIYFYSMPPLRLRARIFSSGLAIGLTRGLLLPVAGWSAVRSVLAPEPWFYGLIFFLFILGASGTKDFSDMEGDRCAGCESLPVRYGIRKAAYMISPFFVLPFLLIRNPVREPELFMGSFIRDDPVWNPYGLSYAERYRYPDRW
jgi:4-hydroxybenzoate polyprenyltransferase